ncbi:MAG TPA: hypothetical protein VN540_00295 [Clostridia bacterium]|nr:hypothetical protein [Clostridia bacterium]
MRRILAAASITFLLALSLYGCKGGETTAPEAEQDLSGFSLADGVQGGGTVKNANLSQLEMKDEGGDTVLTLDFVSDSQLSGDGTQREVSNPPKYKVYTLGKPYRLVIEFESLAFWDYERTFDPDSSELVQGVFNYSPAQGGVFRLYLQLSREVAYKVGDEDSVVTVTLRPVRKTAATPQPEKTDGGAVDILEDEAAPAGSSYYVLANAYRDYCSGALAAAEMTPTLASDGANILIISEAFATKSAATKLMETILAREAGAVPANWEVVLIADGTLPSYSAEMEYLAAYDVMPARMQDAPAKLDVIIPDGLFLAMTPDNGGLLYSRRVSQYEAGGGVTRYELLYVQGLDGQSRQLLDFEFQSIESAKYSPDGRKLAVLERSGESAHLYVFDVDSRDLLTDLSAMGFGDTVSAYCWDSMGGRVFSIGGSNEIVVNQYDFNVPSESKRFTVVDKKGVDETSLAFRDGEVYFCETTLDAGAQMFRVKPEGGLRRLYFAAEAFAFSEDERYLAYTDNKSDYGAAPGATDGAAATPDADPVFAVVDLQTGEVRDIEADFRVYTFRWSRDAKKLFYFENMLSGDTGEGGENGGEDGTSSGSADQDPYPYRLWVYDMETGTSRVVADLTSTNIGISASGSLVYVCYVDTETLGDVVRATYALYLDE